MSAATTKVRREYASLRAAGLTAEAVVVAMCTPSVEQMSDAEWAALRATHTAEQVAEICRMRWYGRVRR